VVLGIGAWALIAWWTAPKDGSQPVSQTSGDVSVQLDIPKSNLDLATSNRILNVSVDIEGDMDIARVEFLLDGEVAASSTESPFQVTISLVGLEKGEHTLQAIAYDEEGNSAKSDVFTFTIGQEEVIPADEESEAVVSESTERSRTGGVVANHQSGGNGNNTGGGSGGGNSGGGNDPGPGPDPDPDPDPTGWPTTPPAQVCGDNEILGGGPTTAPEGAFVVPAGDNESLNLHQANTTYWFAPGVHTLGTTLYGQIIPGDNSVYLGAPGAVLDGQGKNLLAFTQHAENVTIRYLEIRNFGVDRETDPDLDPVNNDEGIINHDSGENWTIEYNYVHDNDGAGVFLGTGSTIRYNCLKDNGQYGFSSYHPDGVADVVLDHNEITGNNQDDWEAFRDGCGCTGAGKFWETDGAVITNNWVHENIGTGIWADFNNTDFLFEGNYIEENDGVGIFYEISYNFMIKDNAFIRNGLVSGKDRADRGDPFPTGAIYISESGGDTRAGSRYAQSEITNNLFDDNWDGVVLWENADRFCRPDEESDTTNNCPFFDNTWGTRFKTQNIAVRENEFHVDRDTIDCVNDRCARNALFSNYGSWPPTSPYKGTVIQEAITFHQNNHWTNNTYEGPWYFTPYDMSNHYDWETWRATPYSQDAESTKS
jgi:parallel beta helix pectate lyase-like protein/Big-like domain-containing protein